MSVNGNSGTTLDDFFAQLSSYDMSKNSLENYGDGSFVSSANVARPGDRDFRGGGGGSRDRRDHRDDDRHIGRDDDRRDRRDRLNDGGDRRPNDDRCNGGDHSRQRRGHHDRVPTPYVDITCQICGIHGHPAKAYWWRYEEDNNDRGGDRGDKGAHVASYGVDTNWYPDMGATDHITGELNKLSTHGKYNGHDCEIGRASL